MIALKTQLVYSHLYSPANKEFIEEMMRMLKELKEITECTANTTQEDMRAEVKIKIFKQKGHNGQDLVGKMKNSMKGLTSRVRAVEDKISELVEELHNNYRQHQKMEKNLKMKRRWKKFQNK